MGEKKEKKTIKIDLWIFYVLVAAMIVLIAAVIIGWTNVAKLKSAQDAQNTQTVQTTNQIATK